MCHSFACDNACAEIDLDVAAECYLNPCFDDCGSPPYSYCNNGASGSNNMMGYNGSLRALTPCQWGIIYTNLMTIKRPHISTASCGEEGEEIKILSGTDIVWDDLKLLNQNVIIETGASLTIRCNGHGYFDSIIREKYCGKGVFRI